MAKTYRRNAFGRMSWVIYQRPWFWQFVALAVMACGWAVWRFDVALKGLGLNFGTVLYLVFVGLEVIGLSTFVVLVSVGSVKVAKDLKSIRRLSDYQAEKKAIRAVENGLLKAGLVRKTVSEQMVDVPACAIVADDMHTVLTVEKLPGVADVAKVAEAVNSSLRKGRFANFAVSEPIQTADGLYYEFELSDVNRDLTFYPEKLEDLVPDDPYRIRLMSNVTWDYPSEPMAIISGLTGSFKSTTMFAMLAQMLGAGADVYIIDYKHELEGFKGILGADHVVSDPEEILEMLGKLVQSMMKRHERIAKATTAKGVISLTGADLNARPVFIIAEELGALSEALGRDKKVLHGYLQQIAMLGRSCLYNLVNLLQIASVENSPAGLKSNTNLKILLGKSTSEMVTQVFSNGYAEQVTNNPGKFRGWYFLNGKTSQPLLFFVPNLHKHGLMTLDTFAKLKEIGKQRKYDDTL